MRLHLVPNSHIDPVWLWDKREGIDEVLNTFRSACDRMDEFPSLTFAGSSLQFYEWVLRFDPALFKRIQHRVAEGRWEVVGSWWIEADSNLPRAVSFRQHARLARAFERRHFGDTSPVAYLPDSFGHPASLPKLLAETGFKYFLFCRPGAHEKADLPANLFYWEYAGRRVLAYRLKFHYAPFRPLDDEHLRPMLDDEEFRRQPVNAFFFGIGNHGGGPTIAEIEYYNRYLATHPPGDAGYSTCRRFFEEAEKSPGIPTYQGDLHMHAVGCYSVLRALKESERHTEDALERTARALRLVGRSTRGLNALWKPVLFNQFHDILPGSCTPQAEAEAREELGCVASTCRDLTYSALKSQSLTQAIRHRAGELRIFNTLPYAVTRPLFVESFSHYRADQTFRREDGAAIDIQKVLESVRCANSRWEFVDTLPARGFKGYWFDPAAPVPARTNESGHFRPGKQITHGDVNILHDGTILRGNAAMPLWKEPPRFLVVVDESDTWGHDVRAFDKVVDTFSLASTAILTGPVTSKLYQRWTYGRSEIDVIYALYTGCPEVYVEITVNWAEHRRLLKLEMTPAGADASTYTMEGPGGPIERRAAGEEMPLHTWLWVPTVGQHGLGMLQDGAFACDCHNGRLRLTLVRSSIYSFHDIVPLVPADPQRHTDQGLHEFRLCWLPEQEFSAQALDRRAAIFLEPCTVIYESAR